jgi:hypothetical protein
MNMTKKRVLYILLVLGIILIGCGVWLYVRTPPAVDIPEGNPLIYEKLEYVMRGEFKYLYIYDDGNVNYIEEKGLRVPSPENPPTRTWKTGKLTQPQLDSLLAYFKNSGLDKLEEYYQFPGEVEAGGGTKMGDMGFTITINSGNLTKTVTAFGYLTPDKDETYPDMPSPLNEIYVKLRSIAAATAEVYQENIK